MNLLDFFFIISGTLLFFISLDIAKKQRFNALHFFVFLSVSLWLLAFTFFPQILQAVGNFFGIARGADVLVYISIIFLLYFSLLLLSKHMETKEGITKLIRELALEESWKREIKWKEVFIIPSYNEWVHLFTTLKTILDAWYHNIIVINDGSNDNTKRLSKSFDSRIIFLHHINNRGQWAALETWFEYVRRFADVTYVVTFDADWQHSLDDLDSFYQKFRLNSDLEIVFGSRFLWSTVDMPLVRKLTLIGAKVFTKILSSQVKLTDTHNGFRVMKKITLDKLNILIDGMWHASEIIDIVSQKKIPYDEVPITVYYTKYSLEKWQSSGNAFWIVLRFIWTKFFR